MSILFNLMDLNFLIVIIILIVTFWCFESLYQYYRDWKLMSKIPGRRRPMPFLGDFDLVMALLYKSPTIHSAHLIHVLSKQFEKHGIMRLQLGLKFSVVLLSP